MSGRSILVGEDNPTLRGVSLPIPKITKDTLKLIKEMEALVKEADGLGLAAPQVGELQKLCLTLFNGKMNALINPEITWRSEEVSKQEEGCLSLPDVFIEVPRSLEIVVKYLDPKGQEQERKLSGLDARIVQHEVDHLSGVLIVDYRE